MPTSKAQVIAHLQRQLLPLQGYKPPSRAAIAIDLGAVNQAFPYHTFPTGAIHEFLTASPSGKAATSGFIMGIIAKLASGPGVTLWISPSGNIFPPALVVYGIQPDKIIFLELEKELDRLWAMEEALKCDGLAAVICETPNLSFTASRRFQLAAQSSGVTGFVLRHNPRHAATTACIARWQITSTHTDPGNDLPGIGFPRWKVELLKIRNGKPGTWQIEFAARQFKTIIDTPLTEQEAHKKAV